MSTAVIRSTHFAHLSFIYPANPPRPMIGLQGPTTLSWPLSPLHAGGKSAAATVPTLRSTRTEPFVSCAYSAALWAHAARVAMRLSPPAHHHGEVPAPVLRTVASFQPVRVPDGDGGHQPESVAGQECRFYIASKHFSILAHVASSLQ